MRELNIKFKSSARPGRVEHFLLSKDLQKALLPCEEELNRIFQKVIDAESKRLGPSRGDLRVLRSFPHGCIMETPSRYPGWLYAHFKDAIQSWISSNENISKN